MGDIFLSFITFILILAVAFVNGWTDAPNSVAACVATGVLPLNKALNLAAISDFAGSVTFGILNKKVTETVFELASFSDNKYSFNISIFSVMLSVVVFAVSAWYIGFPTSESHAILAGIFGTSVCINGGFGNIDYYQWLNTFAGLFVSITSGFIISFFITKIYGKMSDNIDSKKLSVYQILLGMFTAFMHGAQDSQKFTAIAISVFNSDNKNKMSFIIIHITVACIISFGILMGGDRIIKKVGNDLVKLNGVQGFSADFSGALCILCATVIGIPVSTTHIKTSALIGAGSVNGDVNKNTAYQLILSWVLTFPICSLISYFVCYLVIK